MTLDSENGDRSLHHPLGRIIARTAIALTPRSEACLVIGLPVLCFVGIHFIRAALEPHTRLLVTTGDLLGTIGLESLLALLLIPILRVRGWTLARVTRSTRGTDVLRGLGLLLLVYAAGALLVLVLSLPASRAQTPHLLDSHMWVTASPPIIVAVSALNPLFEEFYLVGYIMTALKTWGGIGSASVSVGLRLVLHLYQGPYGLAGIALFAIVFVLYYQRTRTIWPLVIAHGVQDLVGLLLSQTP